MKSAKTKKRVKNQMKLQREIMAWLSFSANNCANRSPTRPNETRIVYLLDKSDEEINTANQLISAAPDLLAALIEVVRCNETSAGDDVETWASAMIAARSAIEKATGSAA